jgi:hypothetical protein
MLFILAKLQLNSIQTTMTLDVMDACIDVVMAIEKEKDLRREIKFMTLELLTGRRAQHEI